MTNPRRRNLLILVGGWVVAIALACGGSNPDPPPKWNCLVLTDGCTCSQPRPGSKPLPGNAYVDRCPAADCCLLNSQADESTLAYCACLTTVVDCEAKAMETAQTKVVPTCPP